MTGCLYSIIGDDLLWRDPLFNPPDLQRLHLCDRVERRLAATVAQLDDRPEMLAGYVDGCLKVVKIGEYDGWVDFGTELFDQTPKLKDIKREINVTVYYPDIWWSEADHAMRVREV